MEKELERAERARKEYSERVERDKREEKERTARQVEANRIQIEQKNATELRAIQDLRVLEKTAAKALEEERCAREAVEKQAVELRGRLELQQEVANQERRRVAETAELQLIIRQHEETERARANQDQQNYQQFQTAATQFIQSNGGVSPCKQAEST